MFDAVERRRKRAAQLLRQDKTQADVVRELEVSRQSVSCSHADREAGGAKAKGPAVCRDSMQRICAASSANSLAPVADVIEAETGLGFHSSHVWRISGQIGRSR